jgi:chromate transporter
MSIVAAGLLLATVIKLAMVLPRRWQPWLFGILAFVGVGVMRWPLLWVIGALAPWAIFVSWKEQE